MSAPRAPRAPAVRAGSPGPEPPPLSMEEAVGYPGLECAGQAAVDERLVLKHDRLFLLADPHGDVAPPGHCGLGLYHDDTRILSHYALRFAGGPAALLSSEAARMFGAQVDLALAARSLGGDDWDTTNGIHIRRELLLDDRLTERVTVTNYLLTPVEFWMELEVGCDFADIFEVRGWRRERRGQFYAPEVGEDRIGFRYRGVHGELMRSDVWFAAPPERIGPRGARWSFRLEPNTPVSVQWQVTPGAETSNGRPPGFLRGIVERRPGVAVLYADWEEECTRWETDVAEFNAALEQATLDLRALYVRSEGMEVISAGIPWYSAPFGRDSIITSLQTLTVNPRIAVDTLRFLARLQGDEENPFTEEQPGRILHELRRGELARAGEIPHVPYYGSIDATPLFLVLLHEVWRWTGDEPLVRELLPNARRALEWIDRYGDMDGDGFVEYARTSEKGLVNQGWKDSWDGVPFPDGRMPEPPIALVEVQGYVHDAKRRMADLFDAFGEPELAGRLRLEAERLRRAIVERFWIEELGTFALALDGQKRPLPTVTSNAGHLLWSRVPTPEQAARMAQVLLGPDMFSGWGIRTLSAAHPVYNPMSYHDGSVWPHDNGIVALGLVLNGHTAAMLPVITALHETAAAMRYHRLPELFCGMRRADSSRPVLYPVSCSPQAWAAGAFYMLLQGAVGILPDARSRILHIREPALPPFLRELTVRGLRIGRSRVVLHFSRRGSRTFANLVEATGEPVHVHVELV